MKIVYTDTAREELARFEENNKNKLEQIIQKDKYVFGDETIEITASDIRQAEKRFNIDDRHYYKYPMSNILLKIYFIAGVLLTVFGMFYEKVMYIIKDNPQQLMFIVAGISLMLVSLLGSYFLKYRMEQRKRYEDKFKKDE